MLVVIEYPSGRRRELVLPAAPIKGDELRVEGGPWLVVHRVIEVPAEGEASLVVRVQEVGS